MSTRTALVLATLGVAAALSVAGCGQDEPTRFGDAPRGADTSSTQAAAPAKPTIESAAPPTADPAGKEPAAAAEDRVTLDWTVPSEQVTIDHSATAPTPYLVAVYTGDHPDGDRPYQRVAFYFREGFPEYNIQYVPSVAGEGTGQAIPLEGNAFLRVGFVNAQAHNAAGESTVAVAPANPVGLQNLVNVRSAGDFEGHLTYGLGLQVAPNSDQVLHVRAGELTKPNDAGETNYVVYVDIETG